LFGNLRLHGKLARAYGAVVHLRAAVKLAQPQRKQLRDQEPLAFLQRLITPRSRRLPL
jgi:hypothetical protein